MAVTVQSQQANSAYQNGADQANGEDDLTCPDSSGRNRARLRGEPEFHSSFQPGASVSLIAQKGRDIEIIQLLLFTVQFATVIVVITSV